MDDDTKKAQGLEQKIKLLTNGYQMRAGTLWSQIEAIFKQMDTAGTELECFRALQKQEQLAASHRIYGLWEEVQKQKELERTLQKRYGDLTAEQERIQSLMDAYRVQEEIAAQNHALELDAAANETVMSSSETAEPVVAADELGQSMPVDLSNDEIPSQEMDTAQVQAHASPKHDMDVDVMVENATPRMDVSSSDIIPSATKAEFATLEGNNYEGFVSADTAPINSMDENHSRGVPVQSSPVKSNINSDLTDGDDIKMADDTFNGTVDENLTSTEVAKEDLAAKDQNNIVEVGIQDGILMRPEDIQETAEDGNAVEDTQVSSKVDGVNLQDA